MREKIIYCILLDLHSYIFKRSARSTGSRKFWQNRIQDSLLPETKIVRRQNKINSFGNLFGQKSHVPMLSTTSARFEFVLRKNKSCVWGRSRDIVTYTFHLFRNNLLFLLSLSLSLTLSLTAFALTLSFSALPQRATHSSRQLETARQKHNGKTWENFQQ